MGWLYVLYAAIIEVFWVLGLKYSETLLHWIGTAIAITLSFYFIIKACERLPAGTVYAAFTGSGAAAIAIIDFTLLGAQFTYAKAVFIGLIIFGVVGIQLSTAKQESNAQSASLKKEGL